MEDDILRDTIRRANIAIDTETGQDKLASVLIWALDRQERDFKVSTGRRKLVIGAIGTIGVAILGILMPALVKLLPEGMRRWLS